MKFLIVMKLAIVSTGFDPSGISVSDNISPAPLENPGLGVIGAATCVFCAEQNKAKNNISGIVLISFLPHTS